MSTIKVHFVYESSREIAYSFWKGSCMNFKAMPHKITAPTNGPAAAAASFRPQLGSFQKY